MVSQAGKNRYKKISKGDAPKLTFDRGVKSEFRLNIAFSFIYLGSLQGCVEELANLWLISWKLLSVVVCVFEWDRRQIIDIAKDNCMS